MPNPADGQKTRIIEAKSLTPMERQALRNQGRENEDGTFTVPVDPRDEQEDAEQDIFNSGTVPPPVPLVQDPAKQADLEQEVQRVRQQARQSAPPDEDDYLKPPTATGNDTAHPNATDDKEAVNPPTAVAAMDSDNEDPAEDTAHPGECPFCKWDLSQDFTDPEIDTQDKRAFIRHLLSDDDQARFYKTYDAMGGDIRITFRSRTLGETEGVSVRIRKWVRDNPEASEIEVQSLLLRLHMTLSLDKVFRQDEDGNTGSTRDYPAVNKKNYGDDPYMAAMAEVFPDGKGTAWYTLVYQYYMAFQRLYDLLSARAPQSDFWKATAGDTSSSERLPGEE